MTALLLEARGLEAFHRAYVAAPEFVLWRNAGSTALSLGERYADHVLCALACRGARPSRSEREHNQPAHLNRSIGSALWAAQLGFEDVGRIDVRVVPSAEPTAMPLRRPVRSWQIRRVRRSRRQALLRWSDALLEARRRAWYSRATLACACHALRPAVIDRRASTRPQRISAADGVLSMWVRG